MARRAVLAIAVALAVSAPDVNADGVHLRNHHPNILERIMEPFVHEFEHSKLGGPAKRSLRDDHSEVVNKLKMEPIIEPFFVQGFGLPPVAEKGNKHKVEVKKVVIGPNSGSDHKVEVKKVGIGPDSGSDQNVEVKKVVIGPDSGSDHKTAVEFRKVHDVSSSSSSGLAEPPSLLSRFGSGRRNVDLMQYFWNNFMAAPHVMHPKVMLLPQKSVFGKNGESVVRTVVHKKRGRNGTGVDSEEGVISVDVEVFVFPNSSAGAKRNATDPRINGALSRMLAAEAQMNGLMSRLFPGVGPVMELPRNRSAYSVVEVFPPQHVAVDRVAVPTSSPATDDATVAANSDAYANTACTKIVLLMLLMAVACFISCVLGSTLPFPFKKNRAARTPAVWVTKTGKLLRLRGATQDASNALPVTRISGPWRA